MPHARQHTGTAGEQAAKAYLEKIGYVVIGQNWHAGHYGEIDIIAVKDDELFFVEVKARRGVNFGFPEEAVTKTKQQKLRGAAQAYLLAHPQLPQQVSFEVVAILLSPANEVLDLKHYRALS